MVETISEAKQEIKRIESVIEDCRKEIENLNDFITQCIKLKSLEKTRLICESESKIVADKTKEFDLNFFQKEYAIEKIKAYLISPINSLYFCNQTVSKLKDLNIKYIWQILQHTEEYWKIHLANNIIRDIKMELSYKGLYLGVDFIKILYGEADDIDCV